MNEVVRWRRWARRPGDEYFLDDLAMTVWVVFAWYRFNNAGDGI